MVPDKEFREMVGRRLKVMRVASCMTQEGLAKASGVSVPTIANTERGESSPTLETAYKIATALGCTPNDLCGWGDVEAVFACERVFAYEKEGSVNAYGAAGNQGF